MLVLWLEDNLRKIKRILTKRMPSLWLIKNSRYKEDEAKIFIERFDIRITVITVKSTSMFETPLSQLIITQ